MSITEQGKIRAIGKPATERLQKEEKKAAAAAKATTVLPAKALAALIAEMNAVMSITPPIKADASENDVRKELGDVRAEDFVKDEAMPDKAVFTASAVKAIRALGVRIPGEAKPIDNVGKKSKRTDGGTTIPTGDLTKIYKARVVWTRPSEDKLPPKAPAGKKVGASTLALRAFLASKGNISPQELMNACKTGGKEINAVSARTYLHIFSHNRFHEFPKFR
jgi:hypothetical protein